MNETWRWVVGFEGIYLISDHGRIYSVPRPAIRSGMIMQTWIDPKGYERATLLGKTFQVHRLVLTAFDRPGVADEEGAHLNGIRNDNRFANLAWKTPVENCADRVIHGTVAQGEKHGAAKLKDRDVVLIRVLRHSGSRWKDINKVFPYVSKSRIIEVGTGKTFRHLNKEYPPCEKSSRFR